MTDERDRDDGFVHGAIVRDEEGSGNRVGRGATARRSRNDPDDPMPTTFYVATLARYVLVDAPDPVAARALGERALAAEAPAGSPPVVVRVVRPATADEIGLMRWHAAQVAGCRPTSG